MERPMPICVIEKHLAKLRAFIVIKEMESQLNTLAICRWGLKAFISITGATMQAQNPEAMADFLDDGGCESLLNIMGMHGSDSEIAANSCLVICILAWSLKEMKEFLGEIGACEMILYIVSLHMGDPLVTEYGSGAIGLMAKGNHLNSFRFAEADGCDTVTQLGNFGFNVRSERCINVATNVCYAIAGLCEAVNSTRLLESGACALVIELAKLHMKHEEFAVATVKALCALASLNLVLREELGKVGACEYLLDIVAQHRNPLLLQDGCEAIMHLSLNPSNTTMLGDCGACEVLVKAFQNTFTDNEVGCEVSASAMLNMATYGLAAKQNRFRLIDAGAVEALKQAQTKQALSLKTREHVQELTKHLTPAHFNLHRARVEGGLDPPMLVGLLGYVDGEASVAAVAAAIRSNWANRTRASKGTIRVLCTTATQGQGKTQLCCHLVRKAAELRPPGVEVLVALPISFNNRTTIDFEGADRNQDTALAWRVLFALGNYVTCHAYQGSFTELLDDIRAANCPAGKEVSSVGILLLVDEVLKLSSHTRPDYLSDMLDRLSTKQQLDLSLGLPTFLMVTSLELVPVSHLLATQSRRVLTHIPVPYLADTGLAVVAQCLYKHFYAVLCCGRSENEVQEFRGRRALHTLIHMCIAVSGRHFRTLETALLVLYEKIVSVSQHERAMVAGLPETLFRPSLQLGYACDLFRGGSKALDVSVRAVFDSVVEQIRTTVLHPEDYTKALELFLQLVSNPGLQTNEAQLYDLEKLKVVFIKARNPDAPANVSPRVSLPFLYQYPQADPRVGGGTQRSRLVEQIVGIIQRVSAALSRPYDELPGAFEDVVPYAELTTVVARLLNMCKDAPIAIGDILPGVVVQPRGADVLHVSQFVLDSDVVIVDSPSSEVVKANQLSAGAAQEVLKLSMQRDDTILFTQPEDLKTQCIEYVTKLFSAGDRQLFGLCSVKLRKGTDVAALARQMHEFAKKKLLDSCGLPESDYYAIIYCCACQSEVQLKVAELPPGTIVVTFECLRQLLLPFGLSPLILEAERRWQKSMASSVAHK